MFAGVVPPAEEDAFGYVGFSAVGPVFEVVDVAPPGVSVASLSLAVAISGDDGPALCSRPDTSFSSHVEDFGVGSQDDPTYRGVASELTEHIDIDDVSMEVLVGAPSYPLQRFEVG